MKYEAYTVIVGRPEGVSVHDMRRYIQSAVDAWAKGGNPNDPRWDIECHKVQRDNTKKVVEATK